MEQNLRKGRFRESIAGKPLATLDELLARAEKYIRIEETSDVRTITLPKEEQKKGVNPGDPRTIVKETADAGHPLT
ncbi:UNVERIFIED_CONTAM: hypothetical protein Sradi_5616700 [Sesamum radiatum]|uniref:Uncharacterized protein n=1 Tax=Sesamum radiatum TaxID=300843 RepID=A0AAW2L0M1_SESRA